MAASVLLLHHLLLFKTPPSSLQFIKPLCLTTALHLHKPVRTIINPLSLSSLSLCTSFLNSSSSSSPSSSSSSLSLTHPQTLSPRVLLNEDKNFDLDSDDEVEQEEELEIEEEEEGEELVEAQIKQEPEPESEPPLKPNSNTNDNSALKLPNLSVKEKKELASYAHSLGKKLKCQQVGKSGVTSSLAAAFVENLESNELLKLKIHNSCPGELADVVKQLEEATGSVAVGQIGRAVILYRPSLTKLKAAEKRNQVRRVFVRKGFIPKPTEANKLEVLRLSGRGRRGSSRV